MAEEKDSPQPDEEVDTGQEDEDLWESAPEVEDEDDTTTEAEAVARVDNQNYGLSYLRSLPAEDVATLNFVNRRDATFRFGGRWDGPVIQVTTLRR